MYRHSMCISIWYIMWRVKYNHRLRIRVEMFTISDTSAYYHDHTASF